MKNHLSPQIIDYRKNFDIQMYDVLKFRSWLETGTKMWRDLTG